MKVGEKEWARPKLMLPQDWPGPPPLLCRTPFWPMSWPDAAVMEVETVDDALLAWRVVNNACDVQLGT